MLTLSSLGFFLNCIVFEGPLPPMISAVDKWPLNGLSLPKFACMSSEDYGNLNFGKKKEEPGYPLCYLFY